MQPRRHRLLPTIDPVKLKNCLYQTNPNRASRSLPLYPICPLSLKNARSRDHSPILRPATPAAQRTSSSRRPRAMGVPDRQSSRLPPHAHGRSSLTRPPGAGSRHSYRRPLPSWSPFPLRNHVASQPGLRPRPIPRRRHRRLVTHHRSHHPPLLIRRGHQSHIFLRRILTHRAKIIDQMSGRIRL